MPLAADHPGGEARAEEMAGAAVTEVEALRVPAAEVLHAGGQLGLRRLDDNVVVVRHQAEDVDRPAVAVDRLRQQLEKDEAIAVVADDRSAVDAARGDVEDPVRQLRAQQARHRRPRR
jgi:hypothetical protein